jgi:DNA-binding CsgD family transcriptional regulator
LDSTALDSIVAKIYSGASGRLPWGAALNELARAADVWTMHLVGLDKRTGGVVFSEYGGDATPQTNLDYIRTYHRLDPRTPVAIANKSDMWFHCHEHFDDAYAANSPFYQDFLIPYGGRYMSVTKIVDDDDLVVALGVHRGAHKKPLDTDAILWLTRIRTHLVEAMSIYRHLRELHYERAAGRHLLDSLDYPIALVDALRGILFKNRAAAIALDAADYIVDRGGILGCRQQSDDAALTAAVRNLNLQADPQLRLPAIKEFVRLHRASDGGPIGVFLSALRPQEVMGAFGTASAALLIFHDPKMKRQTDPFILAEAFDLTPAEAQVAVALTQGKTAEQVAAARAVAIGTVRTQIKSLLAKTGAHRQGDLMRLIVSLPRF